MPGSQTRAANQRWRGTVLVLILLAGVVCLQSVSILHDHSHDRANGPGCVVCNVGQLPVLSSTGASQVSPQLFAEWRSWREETPELPASLRIPGRSRAPPA